MLPDLPRAAAGEGFSCAPCAADYPVRDGVPSFTRADYYYGTLSQESASEVIELAAANRLTELRDLLAGQKGVKVFLRSFDESFADGRFLLPITEESDVLDIGCGFGGLAFPIARTAKRVVAADATFERVAFLARRALADGVTNIEPIHADGLRLPLSNDQFDFVFLNGVLVQHKTEILLPSSLKKLPVYKPHAAKLPIKLQDHNNPTRFRNIWIRELDLLKNTDKVE